jgi:hypothetical protein
MPGDEDGRSLTRILRARNAFEPRQVAFQQDELVRAVLLLKSQVVTATDANHNIANALRKLLEMTFRMEAEEVGRALDMASREEEHSRGVLRGTSAEAEEFVWQFIKYRNQRA